MGEAGGVVAVKIGVGASGVSGAGREVGVGVSALQAVRMEPSKQAQMKRNANR